MSYALTALLFLIVLGGKLVVLDHFGSDIPNWDQWDGEGQNLLLPYLQGRLQWTDFFTAHNEHRMAPSKLFALGLLMVNGQWDSRLECVVNALLHAALAAALFAFGRTCVDRRWTTCWLLAVATFTAPPVAWQNVLGGFHSAQVFILAFAVLAFAFLFRSRTWSPGWWLGLGCAATAIVSQGTGLFVAAVVAALLLVGERPVTALRRHGVTIGVCLALFALGCWLRVVVAYHEPLKAQSFADFAWTVWRSLQWPVRGFVAFPLLAWLPWTWLTWQMIVRRRWPDRSLLVIVGVGGWTLLNYLAAGYARGAGGDWPASRYLDTVALGIVANLLALLVAVSRVPLDGWRRWTRAGVGITSIALLGHGLWQELDYTITRELPHVASLLRERESNTRAYLITGERARLDHVEIPFPNADILADRLSHPEIRHILPVSIRPPLPVQGEADPAGGFTSDGVPDTLSAIAPEPHWGSFTPDEGGRQGTWRSELLLAEPDGYWQIRVAGTLDRPGVGLSLVHADDRPLAIPEPKIGATTEWTFLNFRAPNVPTRLVAHDTSPADWLAFSGPTFMATGSYRTLQFVRHGEWILLLGLIGAIVALGVDAVSQWQGRGTIGTAIASLPNRVVVLGMLTIGGTLVTASYLWIANRKLPEAWIELGMTTDRETTIQLFFSDGRSGFRTSDAAQAILPPSAEPQACRLRIPGGLVGRIRFDPTQDDKPLNVARLRIVDAAGRELRKFTADDIIPLHHIASVETDASGLRIIPEPGANDPYAELRLDTPLQAARTIPDLVRTMLLPIALVMAAGVLGMVAMRLRRSGRNL